MKFLKKIASMDEAVQTNVDVLYATDTEIKIAKALPSVTYSVKNISSPSVDWKATSATINFTGVKTYSDGTIEETVEKQVVTFEQNLPQGGNPTPFTVDTEFVDLGLPSGILWANCNMGAKKRQDIGLYFQWGDLKGYADTDKGGSSTTRNITDKFLWNDVVVDYTVKQNGTSHNYFSWLNVPFNNGSSNYDKTYFTSVSGTVCPNGVLAAQYDAATAAYGEGYRIPTKEDFEELINYTDWSYGSSGMFFYSRKDSSTNIYIPNLNGRIGGGVWSSSIYLQNMENAYYFDFFYDDTYLYVFELYNNYRCSGLPIRAVRDK